MMSNSACRPSNGSHLSSSEGIPSFPAALPVFSSIRALPRSSKEKYRSNGSEFRLTLLSMTRQRFSTASLQSESRTEAKEGSDVKLLPRKSHMCCVRFVLGTGTPSWSIRCSGSADKPGFRWWAFRAIFFLNWITKRRFERDFTILSSSALLDWSLRGILLLISFTELRAAMISFSGAVLFSIVCSAAVRTMSRNFFMERVFF
eukprot:Lithocolla_globosa_v1_NODE_106_length_6331_cov_39.598311.p4 type:complete len:203 gc:universal NODE_106_length_6331_cov_39.598311:5127-4519(-)